MPPDEDQHLHGEFHAAPGTWTDLVRAHAGVIPAYPGDGVVAVARVPPPPKFTPDADADSQVRTLAHAHAAAVAHRYGLHRRAPTPRGKDRDAVVACAMALADVGWPPMAWCAFMLDEWRNWTDHDATMTKVRGKPAQFSWVCRHEQVAERRGKYLAQAALYEGGQLVLGDVHRNLLRVWSRMKHDLLRSAPQDLRAVQEVVHRAFPGDQYEVLVQRAQSEARQLQEIIARRVAKGAYLWG